MNNVDEQDEYLSPVEVVQRFTYAMNEWERACKHAHAS